MYQSNYAAYGGAKSYAKVGLETGVMSASPHQLVTLLFNGAKTAISMGRHHMAQGEIAAKGKAISKAINIIDNGLKISFEAQTDDEAGAALVANMLALFEYITNRLLLANLRNDPALLDEAEKLLDTLGSAWQEAGAKQYNPALQAANQPAPVRLSVGA